MSAIEPPTAGQSPPPEPAQATEIGRTENAPADRHFKQATLPGLGAGPLLPEWFRKLFRHGA
jgi:hypothetical protein